MKKNVPLLVVLFAQGVGQDAQGVRRIVNMTARIHVEVDVKEDVV